jgi:type I restriction enzyme R subunit
MSFNEDSRVKIPALLHLTRLGYQYSARLSEDYMDEYVEFFILKP